MTDSSADSSGAGSAGDGDIGVAMMQQAPHPAGLGPGRVPERIIDSFLLVDGLAVRLELHLCRTVSAVERAFGRGPGVPSWGELDAVVASGLGEVPDGSWFPLLEVRRDATGRIAVTMQSRRPAPSIRTSTRLAVALDRRELPSFKGADGEVTAADRAAARDAGDDDAVYLDADGCVLEAANGAVVGWRGGELLVPEAPGRILPSTMVGAMASHLAGWRPPGEQLPRSLAAERIVDSAVLRRARFRPDEVDELWYVNALHGFTPVVAFDGEPRTFEPTRLAAWNETARNWWEPVA